MKRILSLAIAGAALVLGLLGCASPVARTPPPASGWLQAPVDTPLGGLADVHQVPAGRSGFRPLLQAGNAMNTRLALIAQAQAGVDLQTYHLGSDTTGHEILRALRDAARRGVRVRLLIDDFHTVGMTDLLLGMAAEPGVELRLYNPFTAGRDSQALRLGVMLGDFSQLNRRMHNKLFVADGRAAVFGGRNLSDAYFMRDEDANFFDFDLLGVGQVATDLSESFDRYWNSLYAVPVQALASNAMDTDQRRASFDTLTREVAATASLVAADTQAAIADLAALPLVVADAKVYFDSTDKTGGGVGSLGGGPPLPVGTLVRGARERIVVVSPYFLPSAVGVKLLRDARSRGVDVQVLTSSLRDTDEPLVSLAYGRQRHDYLRAGLRLFELSSDRYKDERQARQSLGASVARLHAKVGLIDDRLLLVGSMNIDPRSAHTNTELAVAIDSAELVRAVQNHFQPTVSRVAHEVRLAADGQRLVWVHVDEQGVEQIHPEPSLPTLRLLGLWLVSLFVSDDLL